MFVRIQSNPEPSPHHHERQELPIPEHSLSMRVTGPKNVSGRLHA